MMQSVVHEVVAAVPNRKETPKECEMNGVLYPDNFQDRKVANRSVEERKHRRKNKSIPE